MAKTRRSRAKSVDNLGDSVRDTSAPEHGDVIFIEGLTPLQSRFAHYYTIELKGWRAAQRAGYKGDSNALGVVASENLRKPKIKAAIDALLEERSMSKAETIARLADIARGDIRDLANLSLEEIIEHPEGRLVKKLKRRIFRRENGLSEEVIEIEMYPADSAIDRLLKIHGLLVDKHEHTGKDGAPIQVSADVTSLTDEQLDAIIARAAAKGLLK